MLTHISCNRQIKIYLFFILLMYSCYIVRTTNSIKNNLQGDPECGIFITRKAYTCQKSYYSRFAHGHNRTCKAVPVHATKAYKERSTPPLILNSVLHGDDWSSSLPSHLTSRKEPRYPMNKKLGGTDSCSGHCGDKKNLLLHWYSNRSSFSL